MPGKWRNRKRSLHFDIKRLLKCPVVSKKNLVPFRTKLWQEITKQYFDLTRYPNRTRALQLYRCYCKVIGFGGTLSTETKHGCLEDDEKIKNPESEVEDMSMTSTDNTDNRKQKRSIERVAGDLMKIAVERQNKENLLQSLPESSETETERLQGKRNNPTDSYSYQETQLAYDNSKKENLINTKRQVKN